MSLTIDSAKVEAVLFDFMGVVGDIRPTLMGETGGRHRIEPVREVVDGILRLRTTGMKTCLVSNNDRSTFLQETKFIDFDAMFVGMVFSSDKGYAKPDRRIYELAAAQVDAAPEHCLFIDDLAYNVDAAIACGMQGVVADRPSTVVDVIEFLIAS